MNLRVSACAVVVALGSFACSSSSSSSSGGGGGGTGADAGGGDGSSPGSDSGSTDAAPEGGGGGDGGVGWALGSGGFCAETGNTTCYNGAGSSMAYEADFHSTCSALGFHFPATGVAPTAGSYAVHAVNSAIAWQGAPPNGQVNVQYNNFNGTEEWYAQSGTVVVTILNAKPALSFNGVVMQKLASTTQMPLSGSAACVP